MVEEWSCPICLDLIYKPCVNRCGHVFCFWCLHLSMNSRQVSKCPYCRRELFHFPAVCEALHVYLKSTFPEEYARREAATRAQEDAQGMSSFAIDDTQISEDQGALAAAFACVSCHSTAYNACIQGCGHLVCGRRQCRGQICPKCNALLHFVPTACPQLRDLIQSLPSGPARSPVLNEASQQHAEGRDAEAQTPPVTEGIEEDAYEQQSASSAEREPDTVHLGIGCDGMGCGLCPIIGRRYRCLDCPERMGFDLCGKCYDHNLQHPNLVGRFNQSHKPEHRMEQVAGVPQMNNFQVLQRLLSLLPTATPSGQQIRDVETFLTSLAPAARDSELVAALASALHDLRGDGLTEGDPSQPAEQPGRAGHPPGSNNH